jgi:tRNA-2-methylthio-N6-dimethylallyladenosine synthase
MEDLLVNSGYEPTDALEGSDVIVMNTCHIREKASEKVFSELGKIKKYKRRKIAEGKYPAVVVAGCVAKALGEKIFKRAPLTDIIVSGESYHKIAEMLDEVFEKNRRVAALELTPGEKFSSLPRRRKIRGPSEDVVAQTGCDKFCAYCVVPHTRGREYSRPAMEILDEVKYLADSGVKEIVLLGQNVDSYHGQSETGGELDLSELIYRVNAIDGVERIRYMTSYPSHFSDAMIGAHRELKKLMPFIHLPAQSGSNAVLRRMNRKYTRESYLELIEKIRKNIPNAAISSDFIVGFAGETEKDFEETLSLAEKIGFASSFSFKYSPRPGAPSCAMANQTDEKTKSERLKILQKLLSAQQIEFNKKFVGKSLEILIENSLLRGKLFGKSIYSQPIIIDNSKNYKIGDIVEVRIKKASLRTLEG